MGPLDVVVEHVNSQVDDAVDDQHRDPVGMRGCVGLDVLRPVALAVEMELIDTEVLPDRLQVLDRLQGRVVRQVGLHHAGLCQAAVDE